MLSRNFRSTASASHVKMESKYVNIKYSVTFQVLLIITDNLCLNNYN